MPAVEPRLFTHPKSSAQLIRTGDLEGECKIKALHSIISRGEKAPLPLKMNAHYTNEKAKKVV